MAVASMPGQDNLLNSKLKYLELQDLSISQSAQLLGFSRTTISRVYKRMV